MSGWPHHRPARLPGQPEDDRPARDRARSRRTSSTPQGNPRTDNILKVAGGVAGFVAVLVVIACKRDPSSRPSVPDKTPIRMLHDRVLVSVDKEAGERRSSGGIVIPATAAMGGRRLAWSRVAAIGPHVRASRSATGCSSTPRTRPRSR